MILRIKNLKENIEKEINKINNLYDKVYEEVSKSYEKKYEQLKKEENDIKEKLQNEVTKVKEKLENFLSLSINTIKNNEKINKGIKELEKENNQNRIKILTYVSKINKNKVQMSSLFNQLMENMTISFSEEKSNIKYENYYFNGIPIPNNIIFKDIGISNFKICWNIENKNDINLDKNEIKYRVELREENANKNFNIIYEGNDLTYIIENLKGNTNYEIRICSIYKKIKGEWSQIHKVKTLEDVDSNILKQTDRKDEYLKKIYEWSGYKKMELIYRATRDGPNANSFHNLCDNKGPTICLYQNEKGNIFGGYASISWTNNGGDKSAPDSFIFTLTNIHNTLPTKFMNSNGNRCVYHNAQYGPYFGRDIQLYDNFINTRCYSGFPYYYNDNLSKGKSIFTGNFDNNESPIPNPQSPFAIINLKIN